MKAKNFIEVLIRLEEAHPGIELFADIRGTSVCSPVMLIKVGDAQGFGRIGMIVGLDQDTAKQSLAHARKAGLKIVFPEGQESTEFEF